MVEAFEAKVISYKIESWFSHYFQKEPSGHSDTESAT